MEQRSFAKKARAVRDLHGRCGGLHLEAKAQTVRAIRVAQILRQRGAGPGIGVEFRAEQVGRVDNHGEVLVDVVTDLQVDFVGRVVVEALVVSQDAG